MTASRPPVLLIHGIKDDARKMERMARHLRQEGREVHTMSLRPSWGQKGLDELAVQIAAEADRLFAPDQTFDLVAFSMGGLVSRYYVQRLGGLERVRRFVTISTPHQGTVFAYLIANPGCRQMRPGSAFLRDLASDAHRLEQVQFTSVWTPLDLIILPARSSAVPQARNRKLWIVAHPLMVWQPLALRAVSAALDD
ncbi:MAG: triacylglycerol lipase [Chthoniobacter sp.]|jgi:triacylglycerol lipase|nr:triacylglycerol lipase [Chthoniobacter sp.]